jgi:protein-disulfide isomerase
MQNNEIKPIVSAIIIAGALIAGAILLRGSSAPISKNNTGNGIPVTALAPVGPKDRTQGSSSAKVTLILYEDFQCPFCGAISGLESDSAAIKYLKEKIDPNWTPFMPEIINSYVKNGSVQIVYRDFAFLGPESIKAAEAARCAGDQGKFWEYHDYLYAHQNGENQGNFSDPNLKSFAKTLDLDTAGFNKCLDENKYTQAVEDSTNEGRAAGVGAPGQGTPKGFIVRNGKILSTIDGAEPYSMVKPKLDAALK